jgi:hypothetical protein
MGNASPEDTQGIGIQAWRMAPLEKSRKMVECRNRSHEEIASFTLW